MEYNSENRLIDLDRPARQLSVSLISPMFNEGKNIGNNLKKLFEALDRLPYPVEFILVNDGSTDNSLQEAEPFIGNHENFRIVTYASNRGRGYAIRQGITYAKGEIIVVTESDLSWGTDIVERMVESLVRDNLDAVVASPHAAGGRLENIPFMRRWYTKIGNRILRLLMPVKLTMYTGMTRAYRSEIIKHLDLECDGKELHLEIISKLSALGYRIGEISATLSWEISRKKRKSGFNAKRYILSHLTFGLDESPMLVLALVSFFFIFLGGICGIYLFFLSFSGIPVAGRPLIHFSMLSVLVGLFMLVFGFLAQQNKRLERQLHRLQNEVMKKCFPEEK